MLNYSTNRTYLGGNVTRSNTRTQKRAGNGYGVTKAKVSKVAPVNKLQGKQKLMVVKLAKIVTNPENPRKHFDQTKLQALAESIVEEGFYNPMQVKDYGGGEYLLIDGERRYHASHLAGFVDVPVIVVDIPESRIYKTSVSANFHREEMTEIETALAIKKLKEGNKKEAGLTNQEISTLMGKSLPWVYYHLKYLDLHPDVQKLLLRREISSSAALVVAEYKKEDQPSIVQKTMKVISVMLTKNQRPSAMQSRRIVVQAAVGKKKAPKKPGSKNRGKEAMTPTQSTIHELNRAIGRVIELYDELLSIKENEIESAGGKYLEELNKVFSSLMSKGQLIRSLLGRVF